MRVGVMAYISEGEAVLREFARIANSGGSIRVTQRDDLWAERGYCAMFNRLSDIVGDAATSEPLPYLPGNPDFGENKKVIYAMMTML